MSVFKNKTAQREGFAIDTLIGPDMTVRGDLEFSGGLYVEGRIVGKVRAVDGKPASLVLAETGIIGFTIWLAIVGYCFRMMLAIVERGDDIIDDVPLEVPDEVALKDWKTDKALSLCLLLSLTGFFTAAFFLSRSYVVILYLLVAMVVGHYTRMRNTYPSLPAFSLEKDIIRWPAYAVIGVIGLYLTVKVLLAMA